MMLRIAADPKHLGARIGITSVSHTWGSAMTHHPHVHMIVPGGGLSMDGRRWISRKPDFFLPVFVLSTLFRWLMLEKLSRKSACKTLRSRELPAMTACGRVSPPRHLCGRDGADPEGRPL